MTRVQLVGVTKRYPGRRRGQPESCAVDNVSIDVASGEIHAVIGYSGAGKSTLLRLINGLETVSAGQVFVGDAEISGLRERQLREVRGQIGMIFQQFNLFHSKTVWGNIEFPLVVAGVSEQERNTRVSELLSFVGLAEHAHAYPEQLSGGQKQRVGIARALATNPGVLLADEATSALDPETSREVLGLLKRVNESFGITIVLITHEMDVVREIAHRVTVMDRGRAVEQGELYRVFSHPENETTKRFAGTVLPTVPEGETLRGLFRRHPERLATVSLDAESGYQAQLFAAIAARGLRVALVHGGMSEIGGRSFGCLTLALEGDDARVDALLAEGVDGLTLVELTRESETEPLNGAAR